MGKFEVWWNSARMKSFQGLKIEIGKKIRKPVKWGLLGFFLQQVFLKDMAIKAVKTLNLKFAANISLHLQRWKKWRNQYFSFTNFWSFFKSS